MRRMRSAPSRRPFITSSSEYSPRSIVPSATPAWGGRRVEAAGGGVAGASLQAHLRRARSSDHGVVISLEQRHMQTARMGEA